MFGFLGFILIILLFIILLAFALIGNLFRFIFGLGKRAPKQYNYHPKTIEKRLKTTQRVRTLQKKEKRKRFSMPTMASM